jgi:hypothetical protein
LVGEGGRKRGGERGIEGREERGERERRKER